MLNPVQAPTGSRCLYCGCDVSGTYARKCIHLPAPEKGPNRIKFVGFGWSCNACQKPGNFDLTQREDVVQEYLKNQGVMPLEKYEEDKNMSQITVTINAPELVSAIRTLAEALGGKNIFAATPVQTQPPIQQQPMQPTIQQPVQQPVQQPGFDPGPAAGTVPTTAQTYTMEQLAVAATQLVDAGRRGELVNLLAQFGAQALTALPKEQYGNFATHLRAMGARI